MLHPIPMDSPGRKVQRKISWRTIRRLEGSGEARSTSQKRKKKRKKINHSAQRDRLLQTRWDIPRALQGDPLLPSDDISVVEVNVWNLEQSVALNSHLSALLLDDARLEVNVFLFCVPANDLNLGGDLLVPQDRLPELEVLAQIDGFREVKPKEGCE